MVNFALQIIFTIANDVKIHFYANYLHDMTIEVVYLHDFDNLNGFPLAQGYFYHNFPIVGSTKVLCLLLLASIPHRQMVGKPQDLKQKLPINNF